MTEKKLSKTQLKKFKIQEETEAINAKRRKHAEAEAAEDLLDNLTMFSKYNKNNLNITIKSFKHPPVEYRSWIFDLAKANMYDYYKATNGWDDKIKNAELFDERSRYLIAFDNNDNNKPIAYTHFRFEFDQNEYIFYIYELHVEEKYRNKGLGRFITQACEFIALKRGVELVMLTIFKANVGCVNFFNKLNYKPHQSSPEMIDPEAGIDCFFSVIWKPLIKK